MLILMSDILLLVGFLLAVTLLVYVAILATRYWKVHASFRGWSLHLRSKSILYILAGLSNLFILLSQLCDGIPEQKKAQYLMVSRALLAVVFLVSAWFVKRAQRQLSSN